MTTPLRIATRKSPLAMWQAEEVQRRLAEHGVESSLVPMSTRGDEILDKPLAKIGGKGLFIKELQRAMMAGEADLAVHSMKDVPAEFPVGLHLSVILKRDDPTDAFVSNDYGSLAELPRGARVGTCSLRRQSQILEQFPHLKMVNLRGNVNTRLAKLDRGDFDAIVLATSGLERLQMYDRIRCKLSPDLVLPACAQGAIGIECPKHNDRINLLLRPLHDEDTALRVRCERQLNATLGGSCQTPIGAYSTLDGNQITLRALVALPDGSRVLRAHDAAERSDAEQLGRRVGKSLLLQGAEDIIGASARLAKQSPQRP
ncbi:MAG: hydroxymethylbilane synthase, partial [Pseudomonadota bacterium]